MAIDDIANVPEKYAALLKEVQDMHKLKTEYLENTKARMEPLLSEMRNVLEESYKELEARGYKKPDAVTVEFDEWVGNPRLFTPFLTAEATLNIVEEDGRVRASYSVGFNDHPQFELWQYIEDSLDF